MKLLCVLLCLLWIGSPVLRAAEARLIAFGEIPASALDRRGETLGGMGSGVAFDPRTGDVLMMPDRGAGDGSIAYQPRFHRFRLERTGNRLEARLVETVLFRDERGRPFTGLFPDNSARVTSGGRACLDPESLAVAPDGSLYVGDEYRPALLHFDRSGRLRRTLLLPPWYLPRDAAGRAAYGQDPAIASGRTENQGIEAMGILPDGKQAVVILQSGLAQDGGRTGGMSRVLVLDLATGTPTAEYAYRFSRPPGARFSDLSVNDLAVVDADTLLVLERDATGRNGDKSSPARYKAVWRVDLRGATNLLVVAQASSSRHFRPVRKSRVFNLPDLVKDLGLHRDQLAAKWEGLALLPATETGTLRLLMVADNDFLNPTVHLGGREIRFPRAADAVPTQLFEIAVRNP